MVFVLFWLFVSFSITLVIVGVCVVLVNLTILVVCSDLADFMVLWCFTFCGLWFVVVLWVCEIMLVWFVFVLVCDFGFDVLFELW